MARSTADLLLERLRACDIHRIYGYPGDGINAILGALNRADSDPELIQVRHEEMAAFMACAHAKFTGEVGVCLATSEDIPDFPDARYAELIDLKGIRVDNPDEIGTAWEDALAADRPCVLEAITDPAVPPLPPRITFEQATRFAQSVLRGDSERRGMITQSVKQMVGELIPGRR
jgi:thiamine pyrophosphate-dependent acetolactate synthase large subunit-like protein